MFSLMVFIFFYLLVGFKILECLCGSLRFAAKALFGESDHRLSKNIWLLIASCSISSSEPFCFAPSVDLDCVFLLLDFAY